MQRFFSAIILALSLSLVLMFSACGGGSKSSSGGANVAANIDLEPQPQISIDQGAVFQTSVRINNAQGAQIFTLTPTYNTSNPSIATISNNGLVCGGTWDSLTNPVVCTPGPVGTATITATAGGITSDKVTVYVHNHITKITLAPSDADTCKSANASAGAAHVETYTATAFNASNTDITGTVGNFSWVVQTPILVTLLTSANGGLPANQAQLQAAIPGATELTATVSNVTGTLASSGFPPFTICSPVSINLSAPGPSSSFSEAVGSSTTLTQSVIDSRGFDISGIGLTISSSWPGAIQRGSLTEGGGAPGTTGLVASCTPPSCNVNLTQPVYSNVVKGTVTGAPTATTLYIGTTQYPTSPEGNPAAQIIPVNLTASGGTASINTGINLPHVPNSMITNVEGNTLYMGSASGLMFMDENTNNVNTVTNAPGKLLAVSRLGNQAVVADSVGNQVYVFNATSSSVTTLPIPFNANMSAAFSVDDYSLYITSGSTVYVATPTQPLKSFGAGGTVVSTDFLANGSFAYMALSGGGVAVSAACNASLGTSASTNSAPQFIAQVWDGSAMAVTDQTGIDLLATPITPGGCPPPEPPNTDTFIDLGIGTFTAHQMLVLPNSSKVYVLPAGVNKVLFANLPANTAGSITLAGTATEALAVGSLQASNEVYVITAGDNALHLLNATTNTDDQQLSLGFPGCVGCQANLLAVRPK